MKTKQDFKIREYNKKRDEILFHHNSDWNYVITINEYYNLPDSPELTDEEFDREVEETIKNMEFDYLKNEIDLLKTKIRHFEYFYEQQEKALQNHKETIEKLISEFYPQKKYKTDLTEAKENLNDYLNKMEKNNNK